MADDAKTHGGPKEKRRPGHGAASPFLRRTQTPEHRRAASVGGQGARLAPEPTRPAEPVGGDTKAGGCWVGCGEEGEEGEVECGNLWAAGLPLYLPHPPFTHPLYCFTLLHPENALLIFLSLLLLHYPYP